MLKPPEPRLKALWLQHFLVLAESPSLAKAAQALELSPQALSQSLLKLERALNSQLYERHQRARDPLTPDGRLFVAAARELLSELLELEAFFTGFESEAPADTLTIGWVFYWCPAYLPGLLRRLRREFPRLRPVIKRLNSDADLEQGLLEGTLDLALSLSEPQHRQLACLLGEPMPFLIVSAPQPMRAWDQWIYAKPIDSPHFSPTSSAWDQVRYPRQFRFQSNSTLAIIEVIQAGELAAFLPRSIIRPQLAARKLAVVAEPPAPFADTPSVWWNPAQKLSAPAEALLNSLKASFSP